MEDEIAQERRPKLMQDAAKPPKLPAPTRAQSKAAGVLKRPGTEQTTMAAPKKARREEPPRSPEVTIVAEAENFVSPMMGESTNVVHDTPVAAEIPEVQSSDIQQCKPFTTVSSFSFYASSLSVI